MQDFIESKYILNRKIVIEVRYGILPFVLDNRGMIADSIISTKAIKSSNWGFAHNGIEVYDEINTRAEFFRVDINVFTLIDETFHSNEEYWNKFSNLYKTLVDVLEHPDQKFLRIGCRILGTYNFNNKTYEDVSHMFIKHFPTSLTIDSLKYNDSKLLLVYDNGRYECGPVNQNDPWTEMNFMKTSKFNPSFGFAIDTDNYSLNTGNLNLASLSKIKDVFAASLAIEQNIFQKISMLNG